MNKSIDHEHKRSCPVRSLGPRGTRVIHIKSADEEQASAL